MTSFPDFLRAHKDALGWTWQRFARELDVPERTVIAWVSGRGCPTEGAIRQLVGYISNDPTRST